MHRESNKHKWIGLNKRWNWTISKTKYIIKQEANKQTDEEIKEIEKCKGNSNRCYKDMRKIKSKKAQKNCLKVHEIMKNHERHREKNSWIRRRTRKADHVVLERIVLF